jgi:fatty acid desaturase
VNDQPQPGDKSFLKGEGALIIAVVVVVVLLITLPAYRWFFLASAAIGVIVWRILVTWHKLKPVTEEDIAKKRPLGLD